MSDSPNQRSVIVTGAANGLGKGISLHLAADGWNVLAADSDKAGLDALSGIDGIHPLHADLTRERDIGRILAAARKLPGGIHAIVSNAGISAFQPLQETTLADWNRVLATNLTPAFLLAKGAEKDLRASKGAMVLIASSRAHMSEPDTHAYSATKGGLTALTHSLAISLGPDVRVNCISPGWIDVTGGKFSKAQHAQHPAGRIGVPADIADAVSFLLSEKAGFITGAELIIDGGMTRRMIYR